MQQYSPLSPESLAYHQPKPRKSRLWLWLLAGVGGFIIIVCAGLVGFIIYAGTGPDTSVYTGNQVPQRFIETMKSVNAMDDDESLLFFYSDGFRDIKDGFYFVSDKKVVVYFDDAAGPPLTIIQFDEIADLELARNESFFVDSQITLILDDGSAVSFPVSSEFGKDKKFFDAIERRTNVE